MSRVRTIYRLWHDDPNIASEVLDALDDFGIKAGEPFIVAHPEVLAPPTENRLGPSKRAATSQLAALKNLPRSGTQRAAILDYVTRRGDLGMTRDEVERVTGYSGSAVRPRVLELIAGGWLEETTATRPTREGNEAFVLVATEKARSVRAAA